MMIDNSVYTFGTVPEVYSRLLDDAPHILIAGATGSGKSVCINGLIYTALYRDIDLVLIDPKRVELVKYRPIATVYADDPESAENALNRVLWLIDDRYKRMQKERLTESREKAVYVIIDELADLLMSSKTARKTLVRILQVGRASNVHVIAATQVVLAKILSTELLVNCDYKIALRTATKAHSRLIIGEGGAECLPFPKVAGYAEMLISEAGIVQKYSMPKIPAETLDEVIEYRIRERMMGKPQKLTLWAKIKSLF